MSCQFFAAVVTIEGASITRQVSEAMNFTEVCVSITGALPGDSATFTIQTVGSNKHRKSLHTSG